MTTLTYNLVPMFAAPGEPVVQVNSLASSQILVSSAYALDQYTPFSVGPGQGTFQYGSSQTYSFSIDNTTTMQNLCDTFNGFLGTNGSCDIVIQPDGAHLIMGLFNTGATNVFNITVTMPPDNPSDAAAPVVTSTIGTDGQPSTITGGWTQFSPAQDTSIVVNNVTYNGSTNTFPSVIPGFVITVSSQD
jgi:flagellar capping protein FliD